MTKIKTRNENDQSNIELIMKFCSKLHRIIGYPYYFNWSTSTNYYDESPDGELHDIGYVFFRVGKYDKLEKVPDNVFTDRRIPVDKATVFGPIPSIVNFVGVNSLTQDYGVEIKSWEDVKSHKDLIMKCIDKYIAENDKQ